MNREQTKRVLNGIGVVPSRAMGQNFLVDDDVSRWIVDQLGTGGKSGDVGGCTVEVGAGLGALTEHLATRPGRLLVIEKDRRLAARLVEVFGGQEHMEVRQADATETDVRPLFPDSPVRVIGNLPYSVGAGILEVFLGDVTPVREAVFMLQTEVAERLCAEPKTKSFGALTLKVGRSWECEMLGKIGPGSFYPEPQVDSSVVRLRPRGVASLPVVDRGIFDRLVRQGFSQRRKQLKKLLPGHPELGWEDLVSKLGVPTTVRAEEMGLEKWVELAGLYDHATKGAGQSAEELFDVVDETNTVIGQESRAVVHRDGLRHRAVHIFLFNKKGDLFLQKRSHLKDSCPGLWDSSASGHLDSGEDYPACAVRELDEELGLGGVPQFVAEIGAAEDTGWEFVHLYEVSYDGGKLHLPPDEIECGAFFPMPVVEEWVAKRPQDFAPGFLRCLRVWNTKRA